MQQSSTRRHARHLALALCAATPVALLLPGCGGGNGGGLFGNPTPTPTATTAPTPTGTQTSNITLGNGQRAILRTVVGANNTLSGTIQILAPGTSARTQAALSTSIKVGTFQLTGTFSPPRGYNFSATDNGQPLFSMNGLLPTATETGSYSLTTADGQTDSGILPVVGTPFPTTTGTPVPTQPSGAVVSNLTFTPTNGSNFVNAPLTTGTFSLVSSAGIVGAAVQSNIQANTGGVFLTFSGLGTTVDSFADLSDVFASGYIYNYTTTGTIRNFVPESGRITLTAISQNSATVRFDNAVYAANEGNIATGKVTINGTLTAPLNRL